MSEKHKIIDYRKKTDGASTVFGEFNILLIDTTQTKDGREKMVSADIFKDYITNTTRRAITSSTGPDINVDGSPRPRLSAIFSSFETDKYTTIDASVTDYADPKNRNVAYRISVPQDTSRPTTATVTMGVTKTDVSPEAAAIGVRKRIESILDRDEPMRARMIEKGFQFPDDLAKLLPPNMRDIRDLPGGPGDSPVVAKPQASTLRRK